MGAPKKRGRKTNLERCLIAIAQAATDLQSRQRELEVELAFLADSLATLKETHSRLAAIYVARQRVRLP